jgi:hypothetical protein
MGKSDKRPVVKQIPTPVKKVAHPPWLGPRTFEDCHLAWRFSCADRDGPWPWSAITDSDARMLLDKFASFETMSHNSGLTAIRSEHSPDTLSRAAQDRLRAIQRDDVERLYSWHFGNRPRLWCAEYGGMMCILWWDPRHEVYPVGKKHT